MRSLDQFHSVMRSEDIILAFDKFITDKECDFAYEGKDGTTYRVNAFFETGKI